MNNLRKAFVLVALLWVATVFAQTSSTGKSAPQTRVKATKSSAFKPKMVVQKIRDLTKVYGTVVRDGVKGDVVTIGMPKHGRIEVDTRSAKVHDKDGRSVTLSRLNGGSNISATGKMGASKFLANDVTVNYIRPLGANKP